MAVFIEVSALHLKLQISTALPVQSGNTIIMANVQIWFSVMNQELINALCAPLQQPSILLIIKVVFNKTDVTLMMLLTIV